MKTFGAQVKNNCFDVKNTNRNSISYLDAKLSDFHFQLNSEQLVENACLWFGVCSLSSSPCSLSSDLDDNDNMDDDDGNNSNDVNDDKDNNDDNEDNDDNNDD